MIKEVIFYKKIYHIYVCTMKMKSCKIKAILALSEQGNYVIPLELQVKLT